MINSSFFADPVTLLLGAVTGFVFGFLLQKGGVTKFNTIVGQFLFTDFTVIKVMLTAMVVGSAGVYLFLGGGLIEGLHVKSLNILGNVLGGLIFGENRARTECSFGPKKVQMGIKCLIHAMPFDGIMLDY